MATNSKCDGSKQKVAILHDSNTENGVLCDAEHTFHQSILNFQNFVWSSSTHVNVI